MQGTAWVEVAPGWGEGLVVGDGQTEHSIRPGSQLIVASVHEELVCMHCHEVAMPGRGSVCPGSNVCPFLLAQIQHKHIFQHKIIATTMKEQLAAYTHITIFFDWVHSALIQ